MKATPSPHTYGVIGSTIGQVTSSMGQVPFQYKTNSTHTQTNPPTIEVLTTQTTKPSQQHGNKKNGKNKKKTVGANIGANDNNNPRSNKNETNWRISICVNILI